MLFKGITATEARKNRDEFYRNAAKTHKNFLMLGIKKFLKLLSKEGITFQQIKWQQLSGTKKKFNIFLIMPIV